MMRINIRINLHTYIKLIVKPKSLVQRAIHFKEHFKEIGRCLIQGAQSEYNRLRVVSNFSLSTGWSHRWPLDGDWDYTAFSNNEIMGESVDITVKLW